MSLSNWWQIDNCSCIVSFSPSDSCELTIDKNTVNKMVKLSENDRKATEVKKDQSYPFHPDRFDHFEQLLCDTGLTGRCYWEVEWKGWVDISVSYKRISRNGKNDACVFGRNDHSWRMTCSSGGYYVCHNDRKTTIPTSSSDSARVAVYVDYSAGTLSFYKASPDKLIHLHTFHSKFTEPLYPGFGFFYWSGRIGSSVSLCSL